MTLTAGGGHPGCGDRLDRLQHGAERSGDSLLRPLLSRRHGSADRHAGDQRSAPGPEPGAGRREAGAVPLRRLPGSKQNPADRTGAVTLGEWVPSPQLIDGARAFARLCQSMAERMGIRFADAGKWDIPLAYDGVHFTEKGHRAFAAGLLEEIR